MSKLFLLLIIITASVFYTGCKKDKEKSNQQPTCEITAPTNGQEIKKGVTVTISVDAQDNDGSITEVRFFIDGVGKSSATNFPYNYEWNTSTEGIGNHTLKVTSLDNDGGSTSDYISVTIIAGGSKPIADFTANPITGTAPPLTVNFTDQSTNTPTSWQWEFSDGGTSSQQNPSYTYNNDGTYTVTLTVTNEFGSDTKTKTNYIYVGSGSGTGTFPDPRDGQTYSIVTIGSQIWFAENLNYQTDDSWWYNNSSANGDIYGRLYIWDAAMNACPSGWHLPSDEEWKTLEMHLGMSQSDADDIGWRGTDEGKKLKSTSGWYNNGNGTDEVGFSALPGGYRNYNGSFGSFDGLDYTGRWWSATPRGSASAWRHSLYCNYDAVSRYFDGNDYGFSVRCVRD